VGGKELRDPGKKSEGGKLRFLGAEKKGQGTLRISEGTGVTGDWEKSDLGTLGDLPREGTRTLRAEGGLSPCQEFAGVGCTERGWAYKLKR
jgi:hypothetical protein